MNEIEILRRSVRDFFSSSMLKLALIPLLVTMLLMYMIFFGMASYGIEALRTVAETSQATGEVVIDDKAPFYFVWLTYLTVFLFKYSITSWLAATLFYTVGAIFIFHLSVIITLLVIGLLTPFVVNYLEKVHYKNLDLKPYGTILGAFWVFLKALFVMIFLYVLLVPLYFVPLINIIAFYLPLYYFFHKLLNYDVSSTILSKQEYKQIYSKNGSSFRMRTLFLYFISTIPFITLFVAVFYTIYLSHAYFIELEKISLIKSKDIDEDIELNKIEHKESL
ncbi:membrane protein (etoposide-induced protein domain) [Aliarcobacter faecis]|uniref:EI24 domain-containing protein n=1 Tax=Aliarcobacter faecis TaxID=1564138 RepID=UPI00047B9CAB|nr:EI24 domain-containing protein [Aliarcobacter faecis]QKF72649.1 membrane protein (etoposide-induced protein domain) [Aliarcobacter faecis]